MKKVILLLAVMLTGLTTATAAETSAKLDKDLDLTSRYRYTQPIVFVERGVEFLIFADGSFDFNTDAFGYAPKRRNINKRRNIVGRTFGAPGTTRHYGSRNRGVLIRHDYLGRVKRIGNVFVIYDRQGRIKRVGSVYMQYKNRQLKQVGNLRLKYNKRGRLIRTIGHVNFGNRGANLHINDGRQNDWNDNGWNNNRNNDDFYYYRQNGKVKKQQKLKARKRK